VSSLPIELRLPADASELKHARDAVAAAAAAFGLDRKASYEFVFAVNEAVTNAIKHGNPDAEGTVGLIIDSDGDTLVCSVSDCGPFVEPEARIDSGSEENGRGFAFMSAFTDNLELVVEPGLTLVHLRKLRVPAGVLVGNA
jgi:anti-sigma regulatory factor (Ser/Thr protein kinase)